MLETVSDNEEIIAVALPIIDGTYRIRSVEAGRFLADIPSGKIQRLTGGVVYVGVHNDANVEQEKISKYVCDWIIERYPDPSPEAGAPKEPWYRIWNKETGQILVDSDGDIGLGRFTPGLLGGREEYMGDKTVGNLQEMWRIIKFEGSRLRTGPHADDTRTWFKFQNVWSGRLLALISEHDMLANVAPNHLAFEEFKKLYEDYELVGNWFTGNEDEFLSVNDPEQMWILDFAEPAELLDLELHSGATPLQGQEILTTETSEYHNDTDSEQEHTFTFSYEYSDSYNFSWENSLSIGIEVEVSGDFPGFSTSVKTTFQNTLTVGEEQTNTFTYSKSYEFPVKVPPHSIVKASMIIFKGSYEVGFTAKLRIGSEVREERGILRAQLGAGVTQYSVKQVKLDAQTNIPHSGNGGKKSRK